jgi:hypothetical protein
VEVAVTFARGLLVVLAVGASRSAYAQRPALADELTYGVPGGEIVVHYATTGTDAVPALDANTDGVPDFVAEVANTAELALEHFTSLGFRRPLSDGSLGGDGRIDFYLQNSVAADGNAGTDACTGSTCIGYAVTENDYQGFSYPSLTEAIRSVVPHELFHLVQYAYANDQPSTWSEGSAVWAVEQLYGADNADFERFLPAYIERTFRPFERPTGGFGDAYPYGAALWPYFLERRYGVQTIVDTWTACAGANFLDATDDVLAAHETSLASAWVEFTRWNAFTGPHAVIAGTYDEAVAWRAAPREMAIDASGTVYVEGLSARYVPLVLAERSRIEVSPTNGIRIAAWLVADGSGFPDGAELVVDDVTHAIEVDAGSYTLVVSGLSRGTITTAVDIEISAPLPEEAGCKAAAGSSFAPAFVLLGLLRRGRGTTRTTRRALRAGGPGDLAARRRGSRADAAPS